MSESCINDKIPECKCINGPIKSDIALHKKIIPSRQLHVQS